MRKADIAISKALLCFRPIDAREMHDDICRSFVGEDNAYWDEAFTSMHDANHLIETLPNYRSNYNSEMQYNEFLGEGYFVRAFVLYQMARRYGGVPLAIKQIDYDPENPDNMELPRASEEETWEQICADFTKAAELLPETSSKRGYAKTQPDGNRLNPPAFTLPSDLKPGVYRMRFKVDWDNVEPGGSLTQDNSILSNGGAIVDVRLVVHNDQVTIKRGTRGTSGGLNGDVLKADGSKLTEELIPFGEPYNVSVKPAPGFKFSHFLIRHGNISSEDSLLYETPQFFDATVPSYLVKNNLYTIPAKYIDGDVEITPYFKSTGSSQEGEGDYALNFNEELQRQGDNRLESFTMVATKGGTTEVAIDETGNSVYRKMLDTEVSVVPGDQVAATASYTGSPMHGYLYVDLDNDGQFTADISENGKPDVSSELLSYTYFNGKNSLGQNLSDADSAGVVLPAFTIPEDLPEGNYRARYKIDWDNANPAGQWTEGGENQIDAKVRQRYRTGYCSF